MMDESEERMGDYLGVILAAGHGSRMGPFGEELPKPIVPICNKPLMAYQLEHLRGLGVTEVIVVIGHLGHHIIRAMGDGADWGVRLRYVEQEQRLGLAHAVGQLERHVDRPFVLFLGDIFFEVENLGALIATYETHRPAAVLGIKNESDPEAVKRNFSVVLGEDGAVRRVFEKPRYIENTLKGCGIYLFDERIFDGVRRTPRTAMRDEYELTDSIQILIDYDYPVRAAEVVLWDVNITYIGDLIACCRHELRARGLTHLVGAECRIAEGVTLIETVVGDHAQIVKPAHLERCVVMPGVVLDDGLDHRDVVFTKTGPRSAVPD